VAKAVKSERIDPSWVGDDVDGRHPVSEVAADRQGALSPFGEVTFPLPPDELGYQHPVTEINRG
jgi:hypothetical protein